MTSTDDLRRLTAESRARLAAVQDLREQNELIARQTRRRLEESRALLDRCSVHAQV